MDDSNRLYDTIQMNRRRRKKRRTNHHFGRSILETAPSVKKKEYTFSGMRGTTTKFAFTPEPESYENPWDAPIWRKWMGRAEEFWDARLQGRIFWELEKNGSTR